MLQTQVVHIHNKNEYLTYIAGQQKQRNPAGDCPRQYDRDENEIKWPPNDLENLLKHFIVVFTFSLWDGE